MAGGFVDGATVRIGATENVTGVLAKVNAAVSATLRNVLGIGPAISRMFDAIRGRILGVGESISSIGRNLFSTGAQVTTFAGIVLAGFGSAFKASSDFAESMNRFKMLFREQSAGAEQFAETLAKGVRRSKSQMIGALSDFMAFSTGLGIGKDQARAMAEELTSLAVDMGSFNNIPTDDAILKLLSAMSGEVEPVRRLGVDITAAALAVRGIGMEATQAEKAIGRLEIIRETLGRQGAIGDATRTAYSGANSIEAFKSALLDLKTAVGQVLEGPFTNFLNSLTGSIDTTISWVRENKKLVATIAAMAVGASIGGVSLIAMGVAASVVGKSISALSTLLTVAFLPLSALYKTVGLMTRGLIFFATVGVKSAIVGMSVLRGAAMATAGVMQAAFVGSGLMRVLGSGAMLAASTFARSFSAAFVARIPSMLASLALLGAQMQIFIGGIAARVAISFTTGFGARMLVNLQAIFGQVVSAVTTAFVVPMMTLGAKVAIQMQIIFGTMAAKVATVLVNTILPAVAMLAARMQIMVGAAASAIAKIVSTTVFQSVAAIVGPIISLVSTTLLTIVGVGQSILGAMATAVLGSALSVITTIGAAIGSTVLTALGPIFAIVGAIGAKALVIVAIASAIAGLIWAFRDQIGEVFASISGFVSDFVSSGKQQFSNFLEGAKSVFWDVFAFGKEQFFSLLEIGKTTFAGINDAFAAGDFKLAFSVAMAGAKEAFLSFSLAAVTRWEDTLVSLISGLIKLKFWFRTIFVEITGFVSTAFAKMEEARQGAVNSISRGIISGLVKIGAVDAEVAQTLEEDISRQQKGRADQIAANTARQVAEIEKEKQAALGGVDAGVKKFKEGLSTALDSARVDSKRLNKEAADAAKKAQEAIIIPGGFDNKVLEAIGEVDVTANVTASLKGMDVRSSEGWQKMVDAMNGARTAAVASVAKAAAADFALPGVNVGGVREPIEAGIKMANGAAGQAGSGLAGLMAEMQRNNTLLEQINSRLINDVPTAMGKSVATAIADNEAVVGLPNQARA